MNFVIRCYYRLLSWKYYLRIDWHIFMDRKKKKYYHNGVAYSIIFNRSIPIPNLKLPLCGQSLGDTSHPI